MDLHNTAKLYDAAFVGFRIIRFLSIHGKCICKFSYCFLPNTILNMEIVFSHIYICMTHNTLNSGKINAQGLHLTYIGVSARMRCKYAYSFNLSNCLLEFVSKVRWITGSIFFSFFPGT